MIASQRQRGTHTCSLQYSAPLRERSNKRICMSLKWSAICSLYVYSKHVRGPTAGSTRTRWRLDEKCLRRLFKTGSSRWLTIALSSIPWPTRQRHLSAPRHPEPFRIYGHAHTCQRSLRNFKEVTPKGAPNTRDRLNGRFRPTISQKHYKLGHSYHARMLCIKWCYLQWPRLTNVYPNTFPLHYALPFMSL